MALLPSVVLAPTTTAWAGGSGAPSDGNVTVTAKVASTSLYGEPVPVSVTAANAVAAVPEYNASYEVALSPEVTYVGGSSNAGDPTIVTSGSSQTLIWSNVGDLQAGSSNTLTFDVQPAAEPGTPTAQAVKPGQGVTFAVGVYTNSHPRYVPQFDSSGNVQTGSSSVTDSATTSASTTITSFTVALSDPLPESEMPRGAANYQEPFTLTLANNAVNATNNVSVNVYLPAGLEYLQCGGIDHSTNAPTNSSGSASPLEYTGAPTLAAAGAYAGSTPCPTPSSVTTVDVTPPGASTSAVYTEVTYTNVTSLAASASYQFVYLASIPMRENTLTWTTVGGAPSAASLGQAANLDNNSGAVTTEGEALTTYVQGSGTYAGTLGSGSNPVTAQSSTTVYAEDLAIQSSVSSTSFVQGASRTYTLNVETSQYRQSAGVVVTDTLGNGECPVDASANHSLDGDSQCAPGGTSPSPAYSSVTPNSDGTTTVTWNLGTLAEGNTTTITLPVVDRSTLISAGTTGAPTIAGDSYGNAVVVNGTSSALAAAATSAGDNQGDVADSNPSSASQSTIEPVIEKEVAAAPTGGSAADCSSATYEKTPNPVYEQGDVICFRITVDFPASIATRNTTITDFIPPNATYVAASALATGANTAPSTAGDPVVSGSTLTWQAGQTTSGGGSDLFVPAGSVFQWTFAVTASAAPSAGNNYALVDDLVKLTNLNSVSQSTSLRDDAGYVLTQPVLSVVLGVEGDNGTSTNGFDSNVDGTTVQEGDNVTFRVDLSNSGLAPAASTAVSVQLPAALTCSDIPTISNGGACAGDVITWSGITVPAGTGSPGSLTDGTLTLTYNELVPDGSGAPGSAIGAKQTLAQTATVTSYQSAADGNGGQVATYTPGSGGVPAATDPSSVVAYDVSVSETRTTSVGETANDPNTQATIGETIDYTVTVDIPSGVALNNATVSDPLGADQALVTASVGVALDGTASPSGFTTSTTSNTVAVTFPSSYNSAAQSPEVADAHTLVITFAATVSDVVGNQRTDALTNAAAMSWTDSVNAGQSATSSTVSTIIVEPSLALARSNSTGGASVGGGTNVTFTLVAKDNSGTDVSIGHSLVLVEHVDPGLTNVTPADSGTYNSSTNTITWNLADIDPGSAYNTSVTYTATVPSAAIASSHYSLSATLSGYSLSSDVGRQYSATANDTVATTPPTIGIVPTATKVEPGQTNTYTVTATIPADTTLYDAYVYLDLPANAGAATYGTMSCAASADCSADGYAGATLTAGTTSSGGAAIGWYLVPRQATFARNETARSVSSSLWRLRQAM